MLIAPCTALQPGIKTASPQGRFAVCLPFIRVLLLLCNSVGGKCIYEGKKEQEKAAIAY